MIRGVIKKIGEIFLRDKGKKYIIVEGDKNLINPDYEISIDDLGGDSNNGGSSSGSEEEYSTDYPDDFYIQYINASCSFEKPLKDTKDKVEGSLFPSGVAKIAHEVYLTIPNLIDDSVQLIYDFPESTYNGTPFDSTKYYMNPTGWIPAGLNPRMIALSVSKINHKPIEIGGSISTPEGYIPLTIKFKTTDGKAYKYTIKTLDGRPGSVSAIIVPENANYAHCEVKYLDLDSGF